MLASEIRAAFFKWYADERAANRFMQYFPLGCEQRAFEAGARWYAKHGAWEAYQAGYAAGASKMPKENMQNDFEICCRVEDDK